jgi:hypothetical protein
MLIDFEVLRKESRVASTKCWAAERRNTKKRRRAALGRTRLRILGSGVRLAKSIKL